MEITLCNFKNKHRRVQQTTKRRINDCLHDLIRNIVVKATRKIIHNETWMSKQ